MHASHHLEDQKVLKKNVGGVYFKTNYSKYKFIFIHINIYIDKYTVCQSSLKKLR